MRFVLVSTHIDQTTGYAKVAYNMLKQLSTLGPKVKTFHYGFQRHVSRGGIRKVPDGVVTYDAAANEDPKEEGFGFNKVHEYLEMVQPDVVMIYNDPLVIYKFIESMKHERGKSPYKLWVYVDQVYDGIAQPLMDKINSQADKVYCFTEIWKNKYANYGPSPDVGILEHAIDPMVFTNMPPDARKALRTNMNIPVDATILLNANRNSQRKRLDLTIAGFVNVLARNPDAPYYLIIATNINFQTGGYYDTQRIYTEELAKHGLGQNHLQRLMLVDTAAANAIDDAGINTLYNIADIGINTSDGEGFGLCQLEHMYTGAPQIVTDIGSYRSFLNEDVAEFVAPGDRVYFAGSMPLGSWAPSFDASAVGDAITRMINNIDVRKKNVADYQFKSWGAICDNWLEDVLKQSTTGSA